jgi:5'-3' exonuclease
MAHLLLDGDWIIYAAGFAGQKTEYAGLYGGKVLRAPNQSALRQGCDEAGIDFDDVEVFSRTKVDPLEHVLHSAKNMILTQLKAAEKKFPREKAKLTVYVDGDGNFRSRLATIKPYKGNRSSASKPVLFNEVRQYLLENWGANVIFDQESDDAMAIDATRIRADGKKAIICGIDKDMLQVPGIHLNPNKGWKRQTEQQGLEFLYRQCLTGDPVDNIGGCYKIGAKGAAKIIKDGMPEKGMWVEVVRAYLESIERYGDEIYGGLTALDAALENMRLVYLRRQEGELWLPPNDR